MHSSRDQIVSAMRKLDSATIRGKIATGELTQGAAEIAEELLVQRDREGSEEPIIDDWPSQDDPLLNATADFLREPFGWNWIILGGPIIDDWLDRKSTRLNSSHG